MHILRLAFLVLTVSLAAGQEAVQPLELPSFKKGDITNEDEVAAYVDAFLKSDSQSRQLLNRSNRILFAEGYRPTVGLAHDPEASGESFKDVGSYFVRKLYLDLNAIEPLNQTNFQTFVDRIGCDSDKTVNCAGEIALKYDLNLEGRFIFDWELTKIPSGPERETFKRCWLNDSVLGTELRLVAWMYHQLFGVTYLPPERR